MSVLEWAGKGAGCAALGAPAEREMLLGAARCGRGLVGSRSCVAAAHGKVRARMGREQAQGEAGLPVSFHSSLMVCVQSSPSQVVVP